MIPTAYKTEQPTRRKSRANRSNLPQYIGRPLNVVAVKFHGRGLTVTVEPWETGELEYIRVAPEDRQNVLDTVVNSHGRFSSGLVFDPRRFR